MTRASSSPPAQVNHRQTTTQVGEAAVERGALTTHLCCDALHAQCAGNEKLVKAVLCAGLYPNVAKMDFKPKPGAPPRLNTREDGKVAFHPKSVNAKESRFPAKFLIYNTKVKSTGVRWGKGEGVGLPSLQCSPLVGVPP